MAVDLTTNPGGLFRRLGRYGGLLNSLDAFLGSGDLSAGGLVSLGVGIDNIEDQFEATRQDLTQGLYAQRDSYRQIHGQLTSTIRTLAQNCVIEMVNDDTKLPAKTLSYALQELIAQMVSGVASVTRPTVSPTVTPGTNTGTGVCLASTLGTDGKQLDYAFNESLKVLVATDSQSGQATAGQERLTLTGAVARTDPLIYDWPLGSGASLTLTAVDGSLDNSGGNALQNSKFETFTTANNPDNWPISVGSAGTTILRAATPYKGTYSLSFVGNGSELTAVQQPFNTTPSTTVGAGGTSFRLLPSTVYALSAWVKVDSTPAAGVLSFALVDGSGVIQNDAAGAANNITKDLTTVSTTWVNVSGFFRTPVVMPATIKLRIRLSTALTSPRVVYIDHVGLTPATRAYSGGPYVAVFSGATDFVVGDKFTVSVSNNYSSKWAKLLERLFALRQLGLAIPSSGSPTIPDSYIA